MLVAVEVDIVGDIAFAQGHHLFDNRMATFLDVQGKRIVDDRLHIVVFQGDVGEAHQTVYAGHNGGIHLNGFHKLGHRRNQLIVNPLLNDTDFLLRPENLLLVFFQLLCDITLSVGQGLLANPFGWHLVFM